MGDNIGPFKRAWNWNLKWLRHQKKLLLSTYMAASCFVERLPLFVDRHWPALCSWCVRLGRLLLLLSIQWRDCFLRGLWSLFLMDSTAVFVIMWSGYLSLTSTSYLVSALLVLGTAGATIHYLGYSPGLFIVGLFGILTLWIYGNFWVTGILFIIGGYMFFLNHARPLILMSVTYSVYYVFVRVGWLGVFLSLNLAFISNDLLNNFLQGYDRVTKGKQFEEHKESEQVVEDFSSYCEFTNPIEEAENVDSHKSSYKVSNTSSIVTIQTIQKDSSCANVVKTDTVSIDEMKRIINCSSHYEAIGFPRSTNIDMTVLKKEYRKKAMLVHPDKNMGNPLAEESFKKLQSAFEVLSDLTKKKDYDEKLRKEESRSVCPKPGSTYQQNGVGYRSEESRLIECTKCGNSHLWICTTRSKLRARWCQDCRIHHQAKDGDGWVEYECTTIYSNSRKVEIPRALVCAESKIFDVSEWATCQGIACRPNTHRPSFHVNMVGMDRATPRSKHSRFLDVEMVSEDEDLFELWFQQAMASGLFTEASKRRKSWSPFKINQKNVLKPWRRSA